MGLLELPWGCALSPRGALHGNPIPLTASLAGGRVVRAGTADIGLPGHRDADAGGSGGTSPEGASQVPRHYRSASSRHQACFPGTSWGQMWSHTAQRLPLLVCRGAPRGEGPSASQCAWLGGCEWDSPFPTHLQYSIFPSTASCTFKLAYIFYSQNLHKEASSVSELFCQRLKQIDAFRFPEIPPEKVSACVVPKGLSCNLVP